MDSKGRELKVRKISDGVVIDGLMPGTAFIAMELLGIDYKDPERQKTIIPIMHVYSEKYGRWKDMLKLEGGKEIIGSVNEHIGYLALISENEAKISYIKDWEVIEKTEPEMPSQLEGILRCSNINCTTNKQKDITTMFNIIKNGNGYEAQCQFCNEYMNKEEIRENIV